MNTILLFALVGSVTVGIESALNARYLIIPGYLHRRGMSDGARYLATEFDRGKRTVKGAIIGVVAGGGLWAMAGGVWVAHPDKHLSTAIVALTVAVICFVRNPFAFFSALGLAGAAWGLVIGV